MLAWAGTIALLRAVGHALVNEDGKRDARLDKTVRAWWGKLKDTKPDPLIFWQFIERDRNLLLNEAELTVGQSIEVSRQAYAGTRLKLPSPTSLRTSNLTYHMSFGPFAGQDPRDLVRDTIQWWEKELGDIERKAAASPR